jgi:phosphatidylinositol-3-phosphatase
MAQMMARWCALALTALLGGSIPAAPAAEAGAAAKSDMPRYAHIFVIVAENKGYDLIIGPHSAAPNLNDLAHRYGLATQFFAEVHPSEANYIAMLGGDTFGIHDDDAFYCKPGMADPWCAKSHQPGYVDHTVRTRSLMDQLESHHLTWKGYMQSLPEPGSLAIRWPEQEQPETSLPTQLYAAKHNGFVSFERTQHDPERGAKIVGFDVLDRDIASGQLPSYAHIVPNQCDDMHGRDQGKYVPTDCVKSNGTGLIARGDRVIGDIVRRLMASAPWKSRENSAIVITFDEDDKGERQGNAQGCCGNEPGSAANFGGGRIPTIVITNHGPRGIVDDTPYNHYSLLRTTEAAFGIDEYLNHAADRDKGVVAMTPLFAVAH